MALDSKGNQAVDFAWGNFPMQPNDERKTSLLVELGIQNAGLDTPVSAKQTFYVANAEGLSAGDVITVSGYPVTLDVLNKDYTIAEISNAIVAGQTAIVTTSTWVVDAGSTASETAKISKDASGNTGGGAGDYSWSKTTKKASLQLDPTLDGHAIADLGWNGYPGYTPGVSQPPFEALTFTANNGGQWSLQTSRYVMATPSGYYDGNGFTFAISDIDNALGATTVARVQAEIAANNLAGKTITYSGIQTMYGDLPGTGTELEIITAWIGQDPSYGYPTLYIKTVPAEVNGIDMPPYASTDGYLGNYSTFTITSKANEKTGIVIAEVDPTGDNLNYQWNWMTYENAWLLPVALLSPAVQAELLKPETVGKFIATSKIVPDPEHMSYWNLLHWCDQITNVTAYTDAYGVEYIKVFNDGSSENPNSYELAITGEQLVLLA